MLNINSAATAVWEGQTVSGASVLVKYTYLGDATLSGTINGDDYFAIDNGFAARGSGFANGDFDYNGRIDADDYFWIDESYSSQNNAL